uniref:Uncharacterized protein n=1 Tax=Plectus sambesii TaxID=2011161 RepID=A0A914XDM8_9BILA
MQNDDDEFLRECPPLAIAVMGAGVAMLLVLLLSAVMYIRTVYMEKRWALGMATIGMPPAERQKLFSLHTAIALDNPRDFMKGRALHLVQKDSSISPETYERTQRKTLVKYENPMYCSICDRVTTSKGNACEHMKPMMRFLHIRDESLPDESMDTAKAEALIGYGEYDSSNLCHLEPYHWPSSSDSYTFSSNYISSLNCESALYYLSSSSSVESCSFPDSDFCVQSL